MIPEHHQKLHINLITKWQVPYGKAVYCVGSCKQLGEWEPNNAWKLGYVGENIWQKFVEVERVEGEEGKDVVVEYKFFMAGFEGFEKDDIVWEQYQGNRKITLPKPTQTEAAQPISICSFNIRYLTPRDENQTNWQTRKKLIIPYLSSKNYDLVGIQQATLPQRQYLQSQLINYHYYGKPRDLSKDQQCGIFVLKDRYTVLSDQYEWISQSRQEGVVGYDGKLPRYFTVLVVTPKILKKKVERIPCLAVINTHLDHEGDKARQRGIEQILQKSQNLLKKFQKPYILSCCIVMGDLNLPSNHKYLTQFKNNPYLNFLSMRDLKGADQYFTFNGFQNHYLLNFGGLVLNNRLTIDHMYFWVNEEEEEGERVRPVEFIVDRKSEKYLSDHFPIIGKFLWDL